jgi:hypothetical protein
LEKDRRTHVARGRASRKTAEAHSFMWEIVYQSHLLKISKEQLGFYADDVPNKLKKIAKSRAYTTLNRWFSGTFRQFYLEERAAIEKELQ